MSAGTDESDDAPKPDDAAAPASASGLRAKDVLTASDLEALEASLSDADRAELAQWFAKPSAVVVAERRAAGGLQLEGTDEELERVYAARQIVIAEASKHITPEAIDLLERHNRAPAALMREVVPPPPIIDESIIRVRVAPPTEDSQIADVREYQRDEQTDAYLSQAVPQAVLRDLHRVESRFDITYTSPFYGEDEAPPVDPWLELRGVMHQKRPLPPPPDSYQICLDARREFRDLISGSWPDKVAAVKAAREER